MEINYKDKYLKYKTKYFMLKDINQVGNGKKINEKIKTKKNSIYMVYAYASIFKLYLCLYM